MTFHFAILGKKHMNMLVMGSQDQNGQVKFSEKNDNISRGVKGSLALLFDVLDWRDVGSKYAFSNLVPYSRQFSPNLSFLA